MSLGSQLHSYFDSELPVRLAVWRLGVSPYAGTKCTQSAIPGRFLLLSHLRRGRGTDSGGLPSRIRGKGPDARKASRPPRGAFATGGGEHGRRRRYGRRAAR